MKNKFLLVALIGVIMAVGVVLVSCKKDAPCENNCFPISSSSTEADCEDFVSCSIRAGGGVYKCDC
jgi:hypothetical protein